jgi:hypothetical protein
MPACQVKFGNCKAYALSTSVYLQFQLTHMITHDIECKNRTKVMKNNTDASVEDQKLLMGYTVRFTIRV